MWHSIFRMRFIFIGNIHYKTSEIALSGDLVVVESVLDTESLLTDSFEQLSSENRKTRGLSVSDAELTSGLDKGWGVFGCCTLIILSRMNVNVVLWLNHLDKLTFLLANRFALLFIVNHTQLSNLKIWKSSKVLSRLIIQFLSHWSGFSESIYYSIIKAERRYIKFSI